MNVYILGLKAIPNMTLQITLRLIVKHRHMANNFLVFLFDKNIICINCKINFTLPMHVKYNRRCNSTNKDLGDVIDNLEFAFATTSGLVVA